MLAGTVLFLIWESYPTIAISLATAEIKGITGMSNSVQSQMIDTAAPFRRKAGPSRVINTQAGNFLMTRNSSPPKTSFWHWTDTI
jgi:hypothetical protein